MNIPSPRPVDPAGAVLIVEDDAGIAALERRRLERAGFAVLTAASADEALARLALDHVALLLLDCKLPGGVDGIDFFARLKQAGHNLPVVLVTGFSDEKTVLRALRAGVRDFVSKSPEFLDFLPDVVRRVLDQARAERRLAQAQRLESIGVLAGGIAHDFNSLLTVVLGNAELLLFDLGPDDPARQLLGEITKAGEMAAALVRRLLAFSRRQIAVPQILDLNGVIGETEPLLRRHVGPQIYLTTALDPTLYPVKADPGQIEQVVMNLVFNARDAMPAGGHLVVETRNTMLDEAHAERHPPAKPGCYAVLSVADTGVGMDEAIRSRIFEPFFTTKEPGRGTGLGLATVYGIVTQTGGHVEVASHPGHGSTFRVYFPRAEDAAAGKNGVDHLRGARGRETVLLVEHEESARRVARFALEAHGYTVLVAKDGAEALQVGQRHPGTVHLLLTDVVTPAMSGRKLAENLGARRPGLKVLFLSDYVNVALFPDGEASVLLKPVTVSALTRKVREVLDGVKVG